ncbi:DUF456 domain-containing protein [Cognatilysobacter lacus]|uniref:DUF456 domain-containing protein n=1 Tax=Cognatilysobacter lacus TaxID=1643323 RepID=A0A5D8Z6P4_9GAMM|nr:DUF456 domain-containing protein [Lysobacter lacus]TZF90186.1 DUF456 domain-containing protein [Lysobacter lacus]
MPDLSALWSILAVILVIAGIAGTVLPALPGIPLVFGGLLLAAWADGFHHVGGWTLGVLAVLTLASFAIDLLATAMGAKRVGASRLALLGATIGAIAGVFFGFIGIFIGPFVGAVLGELAHRRNLRGADMGHAARVGVGTWTGLLLGTVLKMVLAFAMLGLFAVVWMAHRGA